MSLLHVLESIFFTFLMIAWIFAIVGIISDVFLSKDLGGLAKALWVLFIIGIPWLGVVCYLLVRGSGMSERISINRAKTDRARQAVIREMAGTSAADELGKLSDLKDRGVLTEQEFVTQKAKLLEL